MVDREDAVAETVANKVVEIAQTGVRDPRDIAALAIMELSTPPAVNEGVPDRVIRDGSRLSGQGEAKPEHGYQVGRQSTPSRNNR